MLGFTFNSITQQIREHLEFYQYLEGRFQILRTYDDHMRTFDINYWRRANRELRIFLTVE